jgi:hypothetical protein
LQLPRGLDVARDGATRREQDPDGERRDQGAERYHPRRLEGCDDPDEQNAGGQVAAGVRERLREGLRRAEDAVRGLEMDVLIRQHVRAQDVPREDARRGALHELGLGPRRRDPLEQRAEREETAEEDRRRELLAYGALDERPREGRRQHALERRRRREEHATPRDGARREGAKIGDDGARVQRRKHLATRAGPSGAAGVQELVRPDAPMAPCPEKRVTRATDRFFVRRGFS